MFFNNPSHDKQDRTPAEGACDSATITQPATAPLFARKHKTENFQKEIDLKRKLWSLTDVEKLSGRSVANRQRER